jgi:NADH-quinone oxidoreductase subunit J
LGRKLFSALAVFCGFALTMLQIVKYNFTGTQEAAAEMNMSAIGKQMLSVTHHGYALPFEVISMLLLAAMIGCIVIALRSKPETK